MPLHQLTSARTTLLMHRHLDSTLLKIANKLYKQGKRIQWKIIDADYRLFAEGEQLREAFQRFAVKTTRGTDGR